MAASRMSRIHRLALLLTIAFAVTHTLAQSEDADSQSDFGTDSDAEVELPPSDLKKSTLNNKKFQKYPKTETEWNYKGETKKSDAFKDPKDIRLLRLISEGLLNPQDTLPIVSNDAITSSQINNSSKDISVNVQPEGMSGVVNEGISADSDERTIMEKKKNATKEKIHPIESEASKESDEDIKVNLDANVGVQTPSFNKQKGSITVPAQKQISLSKGKENLRKKTNEASSYEVLSLKPSREKPADDGVFDFVDSPLSDKHLVPAGSAQAQTSRINVKKGPNGQDYEYEYIYYYYEDEGETSPQNAAPSAKGNEIPVSTAAPPQRTTTPFQRVSSSTPKFTKSFSDDGLGTRVKSSEVLHEEVSLPQQNREKFRYSVDNSATLSQPQPVSSVPSKSSFSNDVFYQSQFNSARFPGRQSSPVAPERPVPTTAPEIVSSTARPISRGRSHFNPSTQEDSNIFSITPLPTTTQTKEPQSRAKTSGLRQPGLDLVDSNSFRTHSTNIPTDYEKPYTQFESQPRGKSLKQNYDDLGVTQNQPTSASSTKSSDLYQKDQVIEYVEHTSRAAITTPSRSPSTSSVQVTETIADNTAPFSTLPDNSLTTVYGAGLTDKAAHDLYAIYQTQNEESKTVSQDDRTTVIDDTDNTYFATNVPTTLIFSTSTTTTTTTTTPAPTTTTTAAPIASSPVAGRGRFRGSGSTRTRGFSSTTEQVASASEASPNSESSEKPRSKFQPSNRREPGHRVSAYGRKSTTASPEHDSSTAATKDVESSRPSFVPPRNRYRGGNVRSEAGPSTESQSSSSPGHLKPNFVDRYNTRRRNNGLTRSTTTTAAPGEEDVAVKQENSSPEASAPEQQSTTFRSIRNKLNGQNSQVRPLRPGPKLNLSARGKLGSSTTTTTTPSPPLDADTSGSADVPVEQKQPDENDDQEPVSVTIVTTPSTTTASTQPPDALTRLKNRPKLRITDKGSHAKAQAQQSNNTAALNQNRRQLVNNLLPRKKQPAPVEEPKEEKHEISKPVEEPAEEPLPKSDSEASETSVSEVSSTTESKLSSLIASRRRNLNNRKPGSLVHANKQTASEES